MGNILNPLPLYVHSIDQDKAGSSLIPSPSGSQSPRELSHSNAAVHHQNPLNIFGGNLNTPVICSPEKNIESTHQL